MRRSAISRLAHRARPQIVKMAIATAILLIIGDSCAMPPPRYNTGGGEGLVGQSGKRTRYAHVAYWLSAASIYIRFETELSNFFVNFMRCTDKRFGSEPRSRILRRREKTNEAVYWPAGTRRRPITTQGALKLNTSADRAAEMPAASPTGITRRALIACRLAAGG